ncbi:octopamine receptor-like [Mercenaria mercenaria]|uniref:octopamine receptor-like n=1 Tax=Mercenaria mercenaria TaxID=6596 RepID=UPI001E1DBA30|nr:octopamine receptor-like [Mercenaria mercenaria]
MSTDVYGTIWQVLYILITIPIVVGNGLIILSIIRYRKLRTKMHILIGNLAVSDLITGAVLIPYSLSTDGRILNSNMYLCFGKLSLFVISLGSSCYNLMLISFERFVSITFPLKYMHQFTTTRMVILMSVGWVVTLFNSTLPFFGWHVYNENNTDCVSDTLWPPGYKIMVNWELICAMIFNFVLYAIVMKIALRKARDRNQITGGLRHTAKVDKDVYQLVTMVIVLGVFALCWLPYVIVAIVVTFYETPYTQYIRRCTLIPGLLNSAVNWLIYGYRNSDFRKAFKTCFKCRLLCKESGNLAVDTS